VQHIKQNMLLINHISKSTDSKPKGSKQLTTINLLDNLHQEDRTEEHPKQKPLPPNRNKPAFQPILSKEFPSSVAFDDAASGPMRASRADYQREQNKTRRLNATPSKEKKLKEGSRLPPI
jgi:hypothetical protein